MKMIMNNSSIEFRKFKLDRDVVVNGTLTSTNKNGAMVDVPVSSGKLYLIDIPALETFSLTNYRSGDYYIIIGKNGTSNALYTKIVNSIAQLTTMIVEGFDGHLTLFARADSGTSVTYHIKEIPNLLDWSFYENITVNVTSGTGFNLINPDRVIHTQAYYFICNDSKINTGKIRLTSYPAYNNLFFNPIQYPNISSLIVMDGSGVLGSGEVTFTVKSLDMTTV